MARLLSKIEAKDLVLCILKENRTLSTRDIEMEIFRRNFQCPDTTARTLNGMRLDSIIKGELSFKKKAWLWQLN